MESNQTILLVEDDAEARSLMRSFLEHEGHHVFSCADGQRASVIFRNGQQVDLLLTDLNMPGQRGDVLADELSRTRPALPVVILSGELVGEAERAQFAEKGWRFLEKPCSPVVLLKVVDELLQAKVTMRR